MPDVPAKAKAGAPFLRSVQSMWSRQTLLMLPHRTNPVGNDARISAALSPMHDVYVYRAAIKSLIYTVPFTASLPDLLAAVGLHRHAASDTERLAGRFCDVRHVSCVDHGHFCFVGASCGHVELPSVAGETRCRPPPEVQITAN